jgi:hypothetical protein
VVLVQGCLVLVDDLGWQGEAGHVAGLHAPAQERLGRASGGQLLGVPGIEVSLPAVFDGAASVGELSEEGAGLGDLLFRLVGLGASQRSLLRLAPQAPNLVPDGEVLKKSPVFGVLDGGEPLGQPALIEQKLPVDAWQDTTVHQQVTQVDDGSPGCFLVQPVVGERDAAGGQAPEETDGIGVAEPDQAALGPVRLQQGGDQGLQRSGDVTCAVVEESVESASEGASGALAELSHLSLSLFSVATDRATGLLAGAGRNA